MHNVVTGIINEPQKLWLPDIAKNKMVESTDHETGISDATSTEVWSQDSDEGSGFTFKAEMRKLFAHRGHLQELKVRDLKLLYLSQLCGLTYLIINVGI
jgi:hypothetical protein